MPAELDALLEELLAKATPCPEPGAKKVVAAAAEAGAKPDTAPTPAEGEEEEEEPDGLEAPVMAKSHSITLADGTEMDVIDGMDMLKSLQAEVLTLRTERDGANAAMLKAVGVLVEAGNKDRELLKSMQTQIAALANSGKGRSAVLSVHERTPAKAAAPDATAVRTELLAKSDQLIAAGRMDGASAGYVEALLKRGEIGEASGFLARYV